MLRFVQADEISSLLLKLPDLVRQQQQRAPDFVSNVAAWLSLLEALFVASRLHHAGSIAMLKSGLVTVEHGQVPAGLEFRGRPARSRVLTAVASQALQRAADIASTLLAENQPRLAEAERVAQQIVSAALARGLVPARPEGIGATQYLQMLRGSLVTTADLASAVVHLEGLVGPYDSLILIDRALAPHLASVAVVPQSSTG